MNKNRQFTNNLVKGINEYLQSEQCKADRAKSQAIAKQILPKHTSEKELFKMGEFFNSILKDKII